MASVGRETRSGPSSPQTQDQTEAKLAEKFNLLEKKLDSVVRDVHLPFLDVELYKKYFLSVRTPQRAEHLSIVVDALQAHRASTLRILKLCQEREEIVAKILKIADDFANKRVTTLDAQTNVLQLLFAHQQTTLQVVDGVFAWREQLTRPYPFQFKGQNYFLKIIADCEYIDSCQLRAVLPLRIAEFPLCSNVASLKMFAPKSAASPAETLSGKAAAASKQIHIQKMNADTARLRGAENMLSAEKKLQQKVMAELQMLAQKNKFVTLLSLPAIIPNGSVGIPLTNEEWLHQLRGAIDEAKLRVDDADTSAAHADQIEQKDNANDHSSASQSESETPTPAPTPRKEDPRKEEEGSKASYNEEDDFEDDD